jgi:hypothetical protein
MISSLRPRLPRARTLSFLLSLALVSPVVLTGCVGDLAQSSEFEDVGSLDLNLRVGPGITVSTVAYTIEGNDFKKSAAIDVSGAPTISATIGGIPAGQGYVITLTATSDEDGAYFTGSATFDVVAGQTTSVKIQLQSSSKNGSVAVTATTNVGPVIEEFSLSPLVAYVGTPVTWRAAASDIDGGPSPLTYSWSASAGAIGEPSSPLSRLTHSEPGAVTVTLSVSDGDITKTQTATVTFVQAESSGGSGGATGSGGASSGGASSGGASSGGASSGGASSGGASTGGSESSGGAGAGGASAGGAPSTGGTSSGGSTGGSGEEQGAVELVATAVAGNAPGQTTTVIEVPPEVQPGDLAVVFVLVTGNGPPIASSPSGFVTAQLAAAQHNLSYGPIGSERTLTWASTASANTGATAFFFRGESLAVEVFGSNQSSGTAFGIASATTPQVTFGSGYALFGIQLPVNNTLSIADSPDASWSGPVTDGPQLFTWFQPFTPSVEIAFPVLSGTLSSPGGVKRQAQVFVGPKL